MKRLMMTAALGCLAAFASWGRSFSIDLRQPAARTGARAVANFNVVSSEAGDSGFIRKVNLEARRADVGAVEIGDELSFVLFDDVMVTLTLKSRMPSPLGGDVFLAEASGYEGVKNAVVMRTADGLTVDIQNYLNKKVYKVLSTASGVMVQEMESTGVGCGCDALEPPISVRQVEARQCMENRVAVANGNVFVDILVAYDRNAKAWANDNGGGITNFAQMAVQKMNAALANNDLDGYFRFRLVGVVCVDDWFTDLYDALLAATDGFPGWDSIMDARDEVGADIVTVLVDTGSYEGTTGMGWSLMNTRFSAFSEEAYNCCAVRSVARSHTMTHEVGHNMGCGHATAQRSSPGPQLYPYSAGYYFTGNDGENYCTIMAYETEGPGGEQIPYFSSPAHVYAGVAIGDADHDNQLTLQKTYVAASKWRDARGSEIDGGGDVPSTPLEWVTTRAEALAKARAEGKNIFLISGRDSCGNTIATRDYSCEVPSVKRNLFRNYVCWFNNCDTQSEESDKYFSEYDIGYSLPFIAIIDASKDEALDAAGGYHTANDLLRMLGDDAKDVMALVTFNANGGKVTPGSRSVAVGSAVGALPVPSRDGYSFSGWWTAAGGGTRISASTPVTGDVTYYAHWTKSAPTPGPEEVRKLHAAVNGAAPAVASEYNGYLFDAKGNVKGTIQVKVGKPGKKDGAAAVKASVVLGANKVKLKASGNGKVVVALNGPTAVALAGGEACTVKLGSNGISGTYGKYTIDGSLNFFAAKSGGEAANAVLGKWLGPVSVVWNGGSLGVSIAAKGKAKAKGTLANGTKVSAKSVFLVGEEWCVVPVAAPKANLTFTLWLSRDGRTAAVEGLGDGAIAGKPGALASSAAFHVSKDAALWSSISGTVLADYIPDGFKVASNGGKWVLPKAGKVVYKDGAVDGSKLGENPSALKLSYKAKDGSFKGSFKVYAVNGGKLKATTVNVTGMMAKGVGYGTATIKGKGSVAVTIE